MIFSFSFGEAESYGSFFYNADKQKLVTYLSAAAGLENLEQLIWSEPLEFSQINYLLHPAHKSLLRFHV